MFGRKSVGRSWQDFELENFFGGSLLAMGIVKDEPDLVKKGLEQGENPNLRYRYAEDNDSLSRPNQIHTITPIVQAAVIGSLPITKLLVESGADVNLCQQNGESALANAANRGNTELVSYLLEHGADPNRRASFGTPLALTADPAVTKLLLDHGADPNIPDGDGDLPISGAIDANSLEEIQLLIEYGTDLDHRNNYGETPLERAKMRGNYPAVLAAVQAVKSGDPDRRPRASHPAHARDLPPELALACSEGDFDAALSLLRSGADPNELSAEGKTPLFYCEEVALVCLLVHFGADVNATDQLGDTPLIPFLTGEYEQSNCIRAVAFLVSAGLDVDHRNASGMSARMIAESGVDHDIRLAFEQGLKNVEERRRAHDGLRARQEADRQVWYASVNPLELASSWDDTLANCFNACVLSDLGVLQRNEDFVRDNISVRITTPHSNAHTMLMAACDNASLDVVRYLLALGADVDQMDDTGQTALRYAAISWRDSAEKINALLDAGADVNHRSHDGSAALSDAAYSQNVAGAKALLVRGAAIDNRDDNGYTALSWTCGKGVPDSEIVELLLRFGADVRDLYSMNCALEFVDYAHRLPFGEPQRTVLRPEDLRERHLYEYSLVPMRFTMADRQSFVDPFDDPFDDDTAPFDDGDYHPYDNPYEDESEDESDVRYDYDDPNLVF